jgi:hypothetical protein
MLKARLRSRRNAVTEARAARLRRDDPYGKDRGDFGYSHGPASAALYRCRSSVVEHSLGKGEVESSILSGSTIHPLN